MFASLEMDRAREVDETISLAYRYASLVVGDFSPTYREDVDVILFDMLHDRTADELLDMREDFQHRLDAIELPAELSKQTQLRDEAVAERTEHLDKQTRSKALHESLVDEYQLAIEEEFNLPWPAIRIKVTNRTDSVIFKGYFRASMYGPGHEIATGSKSISYTEHMGLAPGESATWRIKAEAHQSWKPLTDHMETYEFRLTLVRLEGENGKLLGDEAPSDHGAHRIRQLNEQIPELDQRVNELEAKLTRLRSAGYEAQLEIGE